MSRRSRIFLPGDPAGDPGAADPGDAKFAALHARRGDELAWCDTSPGALDDFVECALANATDPDVRAGKVPVIWFTDDSEEWYWNESTASMRAGMLRYIRRDGGDHFPGVVYGESLVNATVEEMLVRVAEIVYGRQAEFAMSPPGPGGTDIQSIVSEEHPSANMEPPRSMM